MLGNWPFPAGLKDLLIFQGKERLLVFRVETGDGKVPPTSEFPWKNYPRVARLRRLVENRPAEIVSEIIDYNRGVLGNRASPDGRYYVVEGWGGPDGGNRSTKLYEASSGALVKTLPVTGIGTQERFVFDPSGQRLLFIEENPRQRSTLLAIPWGELLPNPIPPPIGASLIETGAERWMTSEIRDVQEVAGISLYERGRTNPLVHVSASTGWCMAHSFDPDCRYVVLGNDDGSLSVADLREIRRRLARVGLGW